MRFDFKNKTQKTTFSCSLALRGNRFYIRCSTPVILQQSDWRTGTSNCRFNFQRPQIKHNERCIFNSSVIGGISLHFTFRVAEVHVNLLARPTHAWHIALHAAWSPVKDDVPRDYWGVPSAGVLSYNALWGEVPVVCKHRSEIHWPKHWRPIHQRCSNSDRWARSD